MTAPQCISLRWTSVLAGCVAAMGTAGAAPMEVMVIGDSLSREYQFEFPEFENARNWVEILAENRPDEVSFGEKSGDRYRYNWALPTYSAQEYRDDLTGTGFDDELFQAVVDPDFDEVDVVVVFLGGNDIDSVYGDIYNGSEAAADAIIDRIRDDLVQILDHIRDENSSVGIVLVNVPHVGATPEVKADHPTDPVKTQRVTDALDTLNAQLATIAEQRDIGYADVYSLTLDLLVPQYYYLGGFQLINAGTETGDPRYLWLGGDLSQNFHPNTAGQAVIANRIVAALNARYGFGIAPFSDQVIVESLLGLDFPGGAYDAWTAAYPGLADPSPLADPDADGRDNLVEFAFGLDPTRSEPGPITSIEQESGNFVLRYRPDPGALPAVTVAPQFSGNGVEWQPVAPANISFAPDGTRTATLPNLNPTLARLVVTHTES